MGRRVSLALVAALSLGACSLAEIQPSAGEVTISAPEPVDPTDFGIYTAGVAPLLSYLSQYSHWSTPPEYKGLPVMTLQTAEGSVYVTVTPEVLARSCSALFNSDI